MALLSIQDVSAGFGGEPLLENMDLQIESGERICLLGRNGVGKSTFMKIITGQMQIEGGNIIRLPMLKVACLSQDVPADMAGSVFDVISDGLGEKGKLLANYHHLSHQVMEEHDNQRLLNELDKAQHALDMDNGWQANLDVEAIIEKMSLDADAEVKNLSAGMKRRVLLAQAIVSSPDILLLDEPTNHLDVEAIIWIEEFLGRYSGTLIFVSHDRAFIKKLSRRIIELDRGRLTSYACDYETYLKRKQNALNVEATENALFDKKLAEEEVWIRRGIQARRTRNEGRVRALKEMRNQRADRKEIGGVARMQMQDAKRSGRMVIEAKNVSFGYEQGNDIVANLTTTIMRGDKIGVIGPNGSGKTTLLGVLLKELEVQQGNLRHGVNLEIAYFDQLHATLDDDKSVFENIADGSDTVVVNGNPRHVFGYLQDFMFGEIQARNPVSNLSGGERNRLLLAKLFTKPSNVLVLDEPTNDLDIETLDLLEDFLANYPGTVLMVSHDREFLNNVVTSTLVLEGSGVVKEYVGGYDDWLRQKPVIEKPKPAAKKVEKVVSPDKSVKLSYKEQKELKELPSLIETLEKQQQELHDKMAEADFYKNGNDVVEATTKLKELENQLAKSYARWEEIEG